MRYNGGKGRSFRNIINLIPPHDVYVEAFVGYGSVIRNKRPADINIAMDKNEAVVTEVSAMMAVSGIGCECIVGNAVHILSSGKWTPNTFFYLDPPYLFGTRSSNRPLYVHEFGTPKQHKKLLDVIKSLPGMVMISGYWSDLYATHLASWYTFSWDDYTRGHRKTKEWLWMNYPPPTELHDYSFFGRDYRERERFKKKKERWLAQLEATPTMERNALLSAIHDKFSH